MLYFASKWPEIFKVVVRRLSEGLLEFYLDSKWSVLSLHITDNLVVNQLEIVSLDTLFVS